MAGYPASSAASLVQSDPTPTNPKLEPKAPASSGFPREFSSVIPLLLPAPVGLVRSGHTDLPASQGRAQIQDEASPQVVYLLVAGKKVPDRNVAKNPVRVRAPTQIRDLWLSCLASHI